MSDYEDMKAEYVKFRNLMQGFVYLLARDEVSFGKLFRVAKDIAEGEGKVVPSSWAGWELASEVIADVEEGQE